MKKLFVVLGVVLCSATLTACVSIAQKATEAEVLNHYVGTWKSEAVYKPSKWFPEGKRWVGTSDVNVKWILDGNLQQIEIYNDVEQILFIQRYNQKTNRYERWDIHASGISSYWLGSYNEEAKSMTWKYVDFGSGSSGTIVDQFSEGKVNTSIIWRQQVFFKDVHGNVLLDGVIERRRTEAALRGNAAFAQKSPEAEVLNHYVGTWKSEAVFKPAKGFPEGWRGVGTVDTKWILDGNLQQMEIIYSDSVQILVIQRYNKKTNRYERWMIHSWGDRSYWQGSHNEETKSMTWEYAVPGSGSSGTIVHQFSEKKAITSRMLMEDVHGNVLMDGVVELRRTEQSAE
jgi:hypothetical protein